MSMSIYLARIRNTVTCIKKETIVFNLAFYLFWPAAMAVLHFKLHRSGSGSVRMGGTFLSTTLSHPVPFQVCFLVPFGVSGSCYSDSFGFGWTTMGIRKLKKKNKDNLKFMLDGLYILKKKKKTDGESNLRPCS
jgi:hypothetical protein